MRDHALRQVVGLDLIGHGERLQFRHQSPMSADDTFDEARMAEVIQPALAAITLAGRIDQRQVARLAERLQRLFLVGEVQLLQRDGDLLGKADADKAAGRNRVAVADEAYRFRGGNDLATLRRAHCSQQLRRTSLRSHAIAHRRSWQRICPRRSRPR